MLSGYRPSLTRRLVAVQEKKPRSSGKGRSRKADSREELLDAALKIIAEHGIDALRIEDVCEKVGVTKGSLYWHFQDRQGLIRAAMLEQLRRIAEIQLQSLELSVCLQVADCQFQPMVETPSQRAQLPTAY